MLAQGIASSQMLCHLPYYYNKIYIGPASFHFEEGIENHSKDIPRFSTNPLANMKSGAYIFVAGLAGFCQITTTLSQVICSGEFESISAVSFVESLVPGWNLGDTLDSFPNEDSWNNQPVVESTFDDVKTAGFHSVRLPGTHAPNFL